MTASRFGVTAPYGEACVGCAVKGRKSCGHAKTECAWGGRAQPTAKVVMGSPRSGAKQGRVSL